MRFNEGHISFSSFITILHQVVFGLPLFPFNWSPSQGYFWCPFIADDWASVLWAYNILYIFNVTVYFKRNEMFSPFFISRLYWVEKILNMLNQRKAEHLRHPQARNLKLSDVEKLPSPEKVSCSYGWCQSSSFCNFSC